MKNTLLTIALSLTVVAPAFADGTNALVDVKSRASYALGMVVAHNYFQAQGVDLDTETFVRGLKDALSGGPTLLTQQEMQDTLNDYRKVVSARQEKIREEAGVKNKAEGEAFLAKNKDEPGVITMTNGLQYKVITDGTGPIPNATDVVTVNYRGTFVDGKEFDSSARTGHPAQFMVGGVIPGWTAALTHMKVGSKWQLFIPYQLAYGEHGHPPMINPNAALIFDVELLSIQPPAQPTMNSAPHPPITSDIIKVPSIEEMKKGAKIETIKAQDVPASEMPTNK